MKVPMAATKMTKVTSETEVQMLEFGGKRGKSVLVGEQNIWRTE